MDKLSHTTLYVDDTNIIVTSTDYNYLHKRVNVTLQFISELFQTKQLVLNKNKKFAFIFSWAKTPTHTLNIVLDNQILTLMESTNFSDGTSILFTHSNLIDLKKIFTKFLQF